MGFVSNVNDLNDKLATLTQDTLQTVADIAPQVEAVAAIDTAVTEVAAIDTDVTKVSAIDVDVSKVASIDGQVIIVADNDTSITIVGDDIAKGKGSNLVTDSAILNAITNANIAISKATEASVSADLSSTKAEESRVSSVASEESYQNALLVEAEVVAQGDIQVARSEKEKWYAEAEALTADSYATEAHNILVKIYTSNDDGTFTATDTTEYSALHWAEESALSAQGSANNISVDTLNFNNALSNTDTNVQKALETLDKLQGQKIRLVAPTDGVVATISSIDGMGTDQSFTLPAVGGEIGMESDIALKAPTVDAELVNPTVNGIAQSGYTGFKNLIINGDFQVNQYPDIDTAPVNAGANVYNIDRIKNKASGYSKTTQRLLNQVVNGKTVNTLKLIAGDTQTYAIGQSQFIENLHKEETLTFSAWVRSNIPYARIRIKDDTSSLLSTTHSGSDGWEKLTVTMTISSSTSTLECSHYIISDTNGNVPITNGDYIESTMWQLEEGLVATPFEQRPYGLELSLCQRYYRSSYDINNYGNDGCLWSPRITHNSNEVVQPVQFGTAMRVIPTVTLRNTSLYDNTATPLRDRSGNDRAGTALYRGKEGFVVFYDDATSSTTELRFHYDADAELY